MNAKFHMEPPWEGGKKVYINGLGDQDGHRAHIWKKPSKIFFFITRRHVIMKPGMQHHGLKLYKVYINDDFRLTLTYFAAGSNWIAYTFEFGKLLQGHFMGKPCSKGII